MSEITGIQWTHHTFNPWSGCAKVSAGCANCYAAALPPSMRRGAVWGANNPRMVASDSYWKSPLAWDRAAAKARERRRVFCASVADVFEDRDDLDVHRLRLAELIRSTPNLDWLLLTKRAEAIERRAAPMWTTWPRNVWLGVSVENQAAADERIPHLLRVPAAVRFLSMEPLLGGVDPWAHSVWRPFIEPTNAPQTWAEWNEQGLWDSWIPANLRRSIEKENSQLPGEGPRTWLRGMAYNRAFPHGALVRESITEREALLWYRRKPAAGRFVHLYSNICALVQDDGSHIVSSSGMMQGIDWVIVGGESGRNARPCDIDWIQGLVNRCKNTGTSCFVKQLGADPVRGTGMNGVDIKLADKKGGDPSEWPAELRVRQFPEVPRV